MAWATIAVPACCRICERLRLAVSEAKSASMMRLRAEAVFSEATCRFETTASKRFCVAPSTARSELTVSRAVSRLLITVARAVAVRAVVASEPIEALVMSVSYTHLTLPTNREV